MFSIVHPVDFIGYKFSLKFGVSPEGRELLWRQPKFLYVTFDVVLLNFWTFFFFNLNFFDLKEESHLTSFDSIWLKRRKWKTTWFEDSQTLLTMMNLVDGAHVASTGQASLLVCCTLQILPPGLNFRHRRPVAMLDLWTLLANCSVVMHLRV